MGIRAKIFFAFFFGVLIIALQTVLTGYFVNQLGKETMLISESIAIKDSIDITENSLLDLGNLIESIPHQDKLSGHQEAIRFYQKSISEGLIEIYEFDVSNSDNHTDAVQFSNKIHLFNANVNEVTNLSYTIDSQAFRGKLKRIVNDIDALSESLGVITDEFSVIQEESLARGALIRNKPIVVGASLGIFATVFFLFYGFYFAKQIINPISMLKIRMQEIIKGRLDLSPLSLQGKDELSILSETMNDMLVELRDKQIESDRQLAENNRLMDFDDALRGDHDLSQLTKNILNFLTPLLGAQVATLYLVNSNKLRLIASYGLNERAMMNDDIEFGENLMGQAAKERKRIVVNEVPEGYLSVISALGERSPNSIVMMPIIYNDSLEAMLELGSFSEFSADELSFLDKVSPNIAVAIKSRSSSHAGAQLSTTNEIKHVSAINLADEGFIKKKRNGDSNSESA